MQDPSIRGALHGVGADQSHRAGQNAPRATVVLVVVHPDVRVDLDGPIGGRRDGAHLLEVADRQRHPRSDVGEFATTR